MLNKKKIAILIGIILAIVLIIAIVFAVKGDGSSKVAKLYNTLENSQAYIFNMSNNENYQLSMARKEGKTCIDMTNADEKTTTLIKDGITYLLLHSSKEYIIYDGDVAAEENIMTDMLASLVNTEHSIGKEEINGKKYKYEEYVGFDGFMISAGRDIDQSQIKTRFYFDGNNLAYIKTIVGDQEELLNTSISYDVGDELFEIPSDYAQVE